MNKPYYQTWDHEAYLHNCYSVLLGPNGFECILGEPEDRTWGRDASDVVDELNRLYAENEAMKIIIEGLRKKLNE